MTHIYTSKDHRIHCITLLGFGERRRLSAPVPTAIGESISPSPSSSSTSASGVGAPTPEVRVGMGHVKRYSIKAAQYIKFATLV